MAIGFNSVSTWPAGTWRPRGRGFSMGVVQRRGYVVHFTGQVAWDEEENLIGRGDVRLQTRQCFRNIEAVLDAVGGTFDDLSKFVDEAGNLAQQAIRVPTPEWENP